MGSAVAESGHASLAPSIGAKFCLLPDGNTCFTPRASQPGVFFCVKIPPNHSPGVCGLYCGGGRDGGDAGAGPGNGAATLDPVCGAKERRLAGEAQVGAPLAGASVAIVVVLRNARCFFGHVKHIHDGRDNEV